MTMRELAAVILLAAVAWAALVILPAVVVFYLAVGKL